MELRAVARVVFRCADLVCLFADLGVWGMRCGTLDFVVWNAVCAYLAYLAYLILMNEEGKPGVGYCFRIEAYRAFRYAGMHFSCSSL